MKLGAAIWPLKPLRLWHRAETTGSAAVEFAITAPLLTVLALGIADYGTLMMNTASLQGATRAVAEYARNSPSCASGGLSSSDCTSQLSTFISTLQANDTSLSSASFSYPNSSDLSDAGGNYCSCTNGYDGGTGDCTTITTAVCTAQGLADPRVLQYIRITATQSVSPLVAYAPLGLPSSLSLSGQTTIRIE
jgi:Flp pilus assembly protein TadG